MTVRNIKKSLVAMEDIAQGKGEVSQTRAGSAVTVQKVDIPLALDTTVEMSALDVTKYTRARVYSDTVTYTDYIYDEADLTGIASDTGPGTWLLATDTSTADLRREFVHNFATLADAVASTKIVVGDSVNLKERTTGNGGGAMWDVVLASSVTPNTYNIVACTGVASLTLVLRRDFGNTKYIASSQWGMKAGVVDVDLYKALLIESQATAKDIVFSAGNYDFNGQNVMDGGLTNGQDVGSVRAVGVKGLTTFSNTGSAHYSGFVKFRNINFTDCVQPVYMTGNIAYIDIAGCTFTGCRRSVYHNDTTSGVKISGGWIRHNLFTSHTEDEFVGCVLLHKAPLVDDVLVEWNTLKDIQADSGGTNVFSGILIGNDNHSASAFNRNKANNNTILNCGNAAATYPAPSFGIVIIGLDSEQDNNVVRNGKWLEPLYMKGDGNSQCGNKLHDNQHSGVSMKIMLDTNASKDNFQNDNLVTGQCDIRPAMRMFGDGQSLNNQCDTFTTAQVDAQGGFAYQCTRSTTIDGTLMISGQFKAAKGVSITTAGNVDINIELDSESDGVTILKSTDGELGTVSVAGRIDCIDQSLNVNWCNRFNTSGLEIKCDRSAGDHVFIQASEYSNLDKISLHITDRLSDGLSLAGYAISLYGETSATESITYKVSDMVFKTDRNISVAPFRFVNLSSEDMSIYINDSAINMNGKTTFYVARAFTDLHIVSFDSLSLDLTLANDIASRTLEASGLTVDKFLVNNGIIDTTYNATDVLANHTNATVTASRVSNNKTA